MKNNLMITTKDLYQLLVSECRYGYSRNNHLMPSGAYEHVYRYLPLLYENDIDLAIITAQQLCEECISMQLVNFRDYLDDELNNKQEAFKFIEYLMSFINRLATKTEWRPYNYQNYLDFKNIDNMPKYYIYAINYTNDTTKEVLSALSKINTELLAKNNIINFLITEVLKTSSCTYRKYYIDSNKKYLKIVFDDYKLAYIISKEADLTLQKLNMEVKN